MKYVLALSAAGFVPVEVMAGASTNNKFLILGTKNKALFVNLTKQTLKEIDLGFRAHSYIQHPKNPYRFIAIAKWDPYAALVDFEAGVVTPIHIEEDMPCFGHGKYVAEKNAFFISRVSTETGKGYLTGYDADTLKQAYEYQIAPSVLHDCHLLPDRTMVVASSGVKPADFSKPTIGERIAPSSLIFVDIVGDGKVIRELPIDNPKVAIGHFGVAKGGQIIALTAGVSPAAQTQRGVAYYSPDGIQPLRELDWGASLASKLMNEMLSIAFNADHTRAVITNPEGKTIVLVDVINGKVLKSIGSGVRGITFDPDTNHYIGNYNDLQIIDANLDTKRIIPINNSDGFQISHSMIELI